MYFSFHPRLLFTLLLDELKCVSSKERLKHIADRPAAYLDKEEGLIVKPLSLKAKDLFSQIDEYYAQNPGKDKVSNLWVVDVESTSDHIKQFTGIS